MESLEHAKTLMPDALATRRAARVGVRALSATYMRREQWIAVELDTGLGLTFRVQDVRGMEQACASDLVDIYISPSGQTLHFPRLQVDISIPSLIKALLGKSGKSQLSAVPPKVRPSSKSASTLEDLVAPAGRLASSIL